MTWTDNDKTTSLSRRRLLQATGVGTVGALGWAVAGCGDDDDGDSGGNNTPGSSPQTGTTATTEPAKQGGDFVVGVFADPNSLDPHSAHGDEQGIRLQNVFESLTTQDNNLSYVPSLAEEYSPNDDGTVWTFTIREGVRFHDGTILDADGVKLNFDRVMDTANALALRSLLRVLDRVEVVDERTVRFYHTQPDAAALANIGSLPLISAAQIKDKTADEIGKNPIGTGPFKFGEWKPDDRIQIVRFDDYWNGAPSLDSITYRVIRDETTRITAIRAGEVDFLPTVPYPLLPVLQGDKAVQIVQTIPNFRTYFGIGSHPKFNDVRVRQAIVRYGCPREDILKTAYLGYGEVAVGPVPSVSEWYVDYTDLVYYDAKRAQELLQEAGVTGLTFDVIYPAGTQTLVDALTVWQSALADIGVTMNLKALDNAAFLQQIVAPEGDYDVCFAPSQGAIGDFQVLRVTHHSTGSSNISHNTDDPELDVLIDKAQGTLDFTQRKAIYDDAFHIIIDDSKQYYVTFYRNFRGLSARVRGYTEAESTYYKFHTVSLA